MAIESNGYAIFLGQRAVVVRDSAGGVHGLRWALDRAARDHGLPGLSAADLNAAMGGVPSWPALPRRTRRRADTDPIVTLDASLPNYDIQRHRVRREAWLGALGAGEYDPSWLTRVADVEIICVTPSPGWSMAVITLAGGAEITDRFRALRYVGPASLLSREQWQTILSDRGWLPDAPDPERIEAEEEAGGVIHPALVPENIG